MAESRKTIFMSSVQKELATERRGVKDFAVMTGYNTGCKPDEERYMCFHTQGSKG